MQTLTLRPSDIETGERHRALSGDAVDRLARSMEEIGLKQPISVRIVDEMVVDGDLTAGVPMLVAGAHRLAAAKQLGWEWIDCIEVNDDPISAELWEIAENLHRLDLTKEQRDQHIRRYAELLTERREAEKAISFQDGTKIAEPAKRGRPQGVAGQIAEETGLSKQTVLRALNPAPPEPRAPMPDYDVVTVQYNALMAAWNRAGPEARERFLGEVDGPVFDRTRAA